MTLAEKAREYAQNNNYNPYVYGDAERHYTIGLEKGFMAGYKAAKEEYEWEPIDRDAYGFALEESLDEMFESLPVLVKDNENYIELITNNNAGEWRGDIEREEKFEFWKRVY